MRIERFRQGYDSRAAATDGMISLAEISALPSRMVEAMIAEAVHPIAATGRFGRLDPVPILQMVESECRWLLANHEEISRLLE